MVNTAVTDVVCPAVAAEYPVGLLSEVVLSLENCILFSAVAIKQLSRAATRSFVAAAFAFTVVSCFEVCVDLSLNVSVFSLFSNCL